MEVNQKLGAVEWRLDAMDQSLARMEESSHEIEESPRRIAGSIRKTSGGSTIRFARGSAEETSSRDGSQLFEFGANVSLFVWLSLAILDQAARTGALQ
jgi:hypothetical protein